MTAFERIQAEYQALSQSEQFIYAQATINALPTESMVYADISDKQTLAVNAISSLLINARLDLFRK